MHPTVSLSPPIQGCVTAWLKNCSLGTSYHCYAPLSKGVLSTCFLPLINGGAVTEVVGEGERDNDRGRERPGCSEAGCDSEASDRAREAATGLYPPPSPGLARPKIPPESINGR